MTNEKQLNKSIMLAEMFMFTNNIILTSAGSSNVASYAVLSVTTIPGIPHYGNVVSIALITLLFLKEILLEEDIWNENLNDIFNIAITPLFFSFIVISLFKIIGTI